MPVALSKVCKKVRKKKDGLLNGLGDRDIKRVTTARLRENKLKLHSHLRKGVRSDNIIRTGFFKVECKDATEAFTEEQVRALIAMWVCRDDDELEEFVKNRRPGRPALPKHLALQQRIEKEKEEFRTGFLVPDMTDFVNVATLKRWDGTTGGLAQIAFTRVARDPVPKQAGEDEVMEL